ncbi:MAG: hypothetical protein Q4Q07_06560 [Tissierellia bacterium]|nr:hypothetical protein [Tissierellia bacterium]
MMEFKKLTIENNNININVEEEKWIRIRHDKDLEKALEELGNLPIAKRAKEEYRKRHGKDIQIETNSLAVEISGHVLPGDVSYKIQELNLGKTINKLMEEIQRHTDIIDCGEKEVDGNRFIWDMLQIKPLIQDKREETK